MIDDRWWTFKYKVSDYWCSFTYIWRKPYYKLRLLYKLSKVYYHGPWELVDPLLDYSFIMFCEWYQGQRPDLYYINEDPEVQAERKELMELYEWYTVTKKQDEEGVETLMDFWWSKEDQSSIFSHKQCCLYLQNLRSHLSQLHFEEMMRVYDKEQEMLERLIKIRRSLSN